MTLTVHVVYLYSVDVSVKRVGGAYGSKITRPNLIAAACALGAHVTRRYAWSLEW